MAAIAYFFVDSFSGQTPGEGSAPGNAGGERKPNHTIVGKVVKEGAQFGQERLVSRAIGQRGVRVAEGAAVKGFPVIVIEIGQCSLPVTARTKKCV